MTQQGFQARSLAVLLFFLVAGFRKRGFLVYIGGNVKLSFCLKDSIIIVEIY